MQETDILIQAGLSRERAQDVVALYTMASALAQIQAAQPSPTEPPPPDPPPNEEGEP